MGYYTNYTLKIIKGEVNDNFLTTLNLVTGYEFDEFSDCYELLDVKWYDHEKDMIKLSKVYSDVIFELYGEGEESGDIWKMRCLNGKTEYVKSQIVFDDFTEIKE